MWLKRLVRPLIPDRLMARYRLHQHSRQVRSNVDVLVDDEREVRRWLASTPDTYRVGVLPRDLPAAEGFILLGDEGEARLAGSAAEHTGADAGIVARTSRPRLVGRRRSEPAIDPIGVAIRSEVHRDAAPATRDLVGVRRALRDRGLRIALVPRVADGVEERRADEIAEPVAVILAAVPIHDVGGGSRGARIAVELLSRGFHVVYVALFGTHESVEQGLRIVHPALEHYRFDELSVAALSDRAAEPAFVLIEIPHASFLAEARQMSGRWRVVYDVIDRWDDPALGGEWYRAEVQDELLAIADTVVASSPDLAGWAGRTGREVTLIPNAVDARVFGADPGQSPADLPPGSGPVFGYHGSLYGDWFDWDSVVALAESRRDARIVLIGDAATAPDGLPGNVHLLGLRPQHLLPGYIARFDVGLIPFKVTDTTHAVSPLKVYEYLAMGVPVASTPLRALEGLDGVHTSGRLEEAVQIAEAAAPPDRARVLGEHTWEHRVDALLAAARVRLPTDPGSRPDPVVRPVVHHRREDRRI
ncbi:MAG TPA: glycosyltransferase [Acidimicrobiia bacterium]|nr:glycosyltransferase [Acidimicrobiia bacterium]